MINDPSLFDFKAVYSRHGLPKTNLFRRITACARMKPELFITGVQKAGTTTLANYLSSLPGFIPPWEKEISYFNNDERFNKGENWYKSFFATQFYAQQKQQKSGIKPISFDATANTFEEIKSAKRIKEFNPDARIIVVLRNPVLRAWSHYKMAVKYGFENKSFAEAINAEQERIKSNQQIHNFAFQRLAYVSKGEYIRFLPEWQKYFGNNLLILFYEDLLHHPEKYLASLHQFLNISSPPNLKKLMHLNKGDASLMNRLESVKLYEHYAPFNAELEKTIGKSLPWT